MGLVVRISAVVAVLLPVAGLLNWLIGGQWGLKIGGSRIPLPDNPKDIAAVTVLFWAIFLICLGLAKSVIVFKKNKALGILLLFALVASVAGGGAFLRYRLSGGSLFAAVERNDAVGLSKALAEEKIDPRQSKELFLRASKHNSLDVIPVLAKAGFDINTTDEDGNSVLMGAVNWHDAQAVEALIKNGARVNDKNKYGYTPLLMAIVYRAEPEGEILRFVDLLLKGGADPNAPNTQGETPLTIAQSRQYATIASRLTESGAR